MRQLYYAFIFSKIKYGIEVYGNTSAKNISRVQVIQNKLLKLILSWDWQTSTNFVHSDLKILKYNILNFDNKCIMGRIPENFKTYYKTKVVPYAIRSKGSLDVITCRKGYGSKAVRHFGGHLGFGIEIPPPPPPPQHNFNTGNGFIALKLVGLKVLL